jgi:hypothetical protein
MMGLNQYFNALPLTKVRDIQTAEFDTKLVEDSDREQLCYWRRHYGLHAWMRELFIQKSGVLLPSDEGQVFGQVRLLDDDLSVLDAEIRSGNVRDTTMLFNNDYTLGFCIPAARKAIADGKAVFYRAD